MGAEAQQQGSVCQADSDLTVILGLTKIVSSFCYELGTLLYDRSLSGWVSLTCEGDLCEKCPRDRYLPRETRR